MTRHFLRDDDLSPEEQAQVLDLAATMKGDRFGYRPLDGPQSVALLFDKPSTRTRVSFMVGVSELGGNPVVLDSGNMHFSLGESLEDTIHAIDRQLSAVVWRTFGQHLLETMAANSRVPVVNALSDDFHPCQLLADLLTIREHLGTTKGKTIAYFGDITNNMAHSYALACVNAGMHVRLVGPEGDLPKASVLADAQALAERTGGSIDIVHDVKQGAHDVDVLATDTWRSMGQAELSEERIAALRTFSLTQEVLEVSKPESIVLHCLPAYRGYEIDADVIDGPHSVAFDQAENRLHAQKALLSFLLGHTAHA
jgi:ornithine carbamoyltransferase